jgi:single-strand DNA-binding protein
MVISSRSLLVLTNNFFAFLFYSLLPSRPSTNLPLPTSNTAASCHVLSTSLLEFVMMLDSFCKVQGIGRVGPTPSITFRDDGSVMVSFQVSTALPLRSAGQVTERIVWQKVIAFGTVAEFVRDHIPKGTRVYFEGAVYPSFVTDSRGTRLPQILLAVHKVLPLTTRDDSEQLQQQLTQAPHSHVPPSPAAPPPVDPYEDRPF